MADRSENVEDEQDDSLEEFRKRIADREGLKVVNGETLEEWRTAIEDRDGVTKREAGKADGKDEPLEAEQEQGRGDTDTGEVQKEPNEGKEGARAKADEQHHGKEGSKEEGGSDNERGDKDETASQAKGVEHRADSEVAKREEAARDELPEKNVKDALAVEESPGPKPTEKHFRETEVVAQARQEKPLEPVQEAKPSQIESHARNDDRVLMVAHWAPDGHEREPEPVQTSDLHCWKAEARVEQGSRTFEAVDRGKVVEASGYLREPIDREELASHQFQSTASETSSQSRGETICTHQVLLVDKHEVGENVDQKIPRSTVEDERLPETFKTSAYGHTSALLIPERMIPPHNRRSDVFEVKVSRASEPEQEFALYTTHKPGYSRAYLNLYQLDPKNGEKFLATPATLYSQGDFVREYNEHKPLGLDGLQLVEKEGRLLLKIAGRELQFVESKLRVYQGQVILEGSIEIVGAVKIAKSVRGFDFRLGDHSRVTGLSSDGGTVMNYQRTNHDPYPHRRVISEAPERPEPLNRPRRLSTGRIEIVVASEGNPRLFELMASEEMRERVRESLRNSRTPDEYRKIKGDLAEEIVRDLIPEFGMGVVKDHPFNDDPLKKRSERTGPDFLVSRGEVLGYVEVKWWGNTKEALERGEEQVATDLLRHPIYEGSKVIEGYVAVLDWNYDGDVFALRLKRVAPGRGVGVI